MYSVEDREAGGAAPGLAAGERAVFSAWLSGPSWKLSAASFVWLNRLFHHELSYYIFLNFTLSLLLC